MIRGWRRGLVLAAVAAAAIVGGVLLATRPWSDGETLVQEAAGGSIEQRICDVVMDVPPIGQAQDTVMVGPNNPPLEGEPREPVIKLKVVGTGKRSEVLVDAETGTILDERYATLSHEVMLRGILDTLRVEPLDPSSATWPYTDTAQVSAERVGEKSTFEYRFPDPGSGLMISKSIIDGLGWYAEGLRVANCRSVMEIMITYRPDAEPEVKVTKDIHPEDEAAFQTFYDQVTINNDPLGR